MTEVIRNNKGLEGPTSKTKKCEVCGSSFEAKRSDARTCSKKCRDRKSRRKLDPKVGSPERRAAQLDGLYYSSALRKAIRRDLARVGLLLEKPLVGHDESQDRRGVGFAGNGRISLRRPRIADHDAGGISDVLEMPIRPRRYRPSFRPRHRRLFLEARDAVFRLPPPPPKSGWKVLDSLILRARLYNALSPALRQAFTLVDADDETRARKSAALGLVLDEAQRYLVRQLEQMRTEILDQAIQKETAALGHAAGRIDTSSMLELQGRLKMLSRLVAFRYGFRDPLDQD